MTEKMISEQETIALLLYLIEDLKSKVIDIVSFSPFQLPTLNSIIKCVEERYVLPLRQGEFRKIVIDTDRNVLYAQSELQL